MKKFIALTAASVLAIALLDATAALAADAPPAGEGAAGPGLEEIVVTARRVEENLQRVPVAVTALPADVLQKRNVKSVNDIQFSVPNLQIKPNNTYPSQPEFIIRGQRQVLLSDENVVTYVNGVPQSTRGLTLYDLESVQALKGPQGTLFGKNSMGGAMVFTTKRPSFETEGQLTGEFGNYSRKLVNAMINVPLVTDKVAVRAVGQVERQDGFFKNMNPGQRDLNNRHNESGRLTIRLKPDERFENLTTFDYIHRNEVPTPSLIEAAPLANNFFRSVTQQAVLQQSALGGGTALVDTANGLLIRQGNPFVSVAQTHFGDVLKGAAFPALSHFASKSKVYGLANTTTYELTEILTAKNIFGYRHERAYDHQDPSGLSGMIFDFGTLFGAPPGIVIGPATNNDTYYLNTTRTFTEEVQLIGKTDNFNFIAGGFYSNRRHLYSVNSTFVVGPASFYGPFFDRHSEMREKNTSAAIFAQGTYDFSGLGLRGLRLTGGLRYTREKKSENQSNFFTTSTAQLQSFNPANPQSTCNELNTSSGNSTGVNNGTQCYLTSHRTFHALTWTASLEYQADRDTLIYFASRRGFKAGSPNPTTRLLNYAIFGPERITDFELGFKRQGELGSIPYRLNVAGFIGKYKDIQTQDILQFCSNPAADPSNGAACGVFTDLLILNVGKATIKGVELDGTIKPVPQLQLDFSYAYQVGRYGKGSIVAQPTNPALPVANSNPINFAGGVNLAGREFAGVPRTTFSAAATFDLDMIPESFAKTQISANYYYRGKTKGLSVQGIFQTPSFGTLGARLSFNELFGTGVSLAVWGANLTNKYYKLYCADNLNSIGYAACKWGDPRTYGMTASVKF